MPKQMTERAAWLWLAKKWDEAKLYDEAGSVPHVLIHDGYEWCLCHSIHAMRNRKISAKRSRDMEDKVVLQIPSAGHYKWPLTMRGAKSRAAFCRRMAKECEKKEAARKAVKS